MKMTANFVMRWKRLAKAERAKQADDLARRWAEGSRLQECLRERCPAPKLCVLRGCSNK